MLVISIVNLVLIKNMGIQASCRSCTTFKLKRYEQRNFSKSSVCVS